MESQQVDAKHAYVSNGPVSVTRRHESYVGTWRAPPESSALDSLCTRGEDCGSHVEARYAAARPLLAERRSVPQTHRDQTRTEQSGRVSLRLRAPTTLQALTE